MKINKLNLSTDGQIEDLFVLHPESFEDFRGENFEGYSEERYGEIFSTSKNWTEGKNKFITDSFSKSRKDVLRGFHGDSVCWKLIECLKGSIYFSVIDTRLHSRTFGNHICLTLTEHNSCLLYTSDAADD
jgi:dTDP-4-dehydrorhamnose 3,5-epimerase